MLGKPVRKAPQVLGKPEKKALQASRSDSKLGLGYQLASRYPNQLYYLTVVIKTQAAGKL